MLTKRNLYAKLTHEHIELQPVCKSYHTLDLC